MLSPPQTDPPNTASRQVVSAPPGGRPEPPPSQHRCAPVSNLSPLNPGPTNRLPTIPRGHQSAEDAGCQTECSPRKYSNVQPMTPKADRNMPMMTSHQPTARPRKMTAPEAASASGHQLWGLKNPSSPSAAEMSADGSSSGRGSSLRPVSQR